jgi:lipopolysaccharide/colanic/teichoic acid biosynthesis glycosyltransferase
MDSVLAGVALIALSPLLLVVAIGIRLTMGSPVFYRQTRPGHLGRPFQIFKFRSMLPEIDRDGQRRPVNERVTRLGRQLRRTSIDELPELWNVLVGDMSLVGPRPLLMEYLPRYSPEQNRRHLVKPGLTGLAQVKGRHLVSWDDRFALDVWYVDHWSLALDLRILRATMALVLKGHGVPDPTAEGYEFMGLGPKES